MKQLYTLLFRQYTFSGVLFFLFCTACIWFSSLTAIHAAECITIADAPLELPYTVSSVNVMYVLDDSGSMDWECLVTTDADNNPNGNFIADGLVKYYLFDEVKEVDDWQNDTDDSLNLYPYQSYSNNYMTRDNRLYWKSQWNGINKLYYNPDIEYTPWYTTNNSMQDQDPDNPRFHPYNAVPTVSMSSEFTSLNPFLVDDQVNDTDYFAVKNNSGWYDWSASPNGPWNGKDKVTTANGDWAEYYIAAPPAAGNNDICIFIPPILRFSDSYKNTARYATYEIQEGNTTIMASTQVYQTDPTRTDITGVTVLDELIPDSGWYKLGTFNLDGTKDITIRVTKSAGSYAHADAAKIVITGETDSGGLSIPIAHYYAWSTLQNCPYLVIIDDGSISYYKINDADTNEKIDMTEVTLDASPPVDVVTSRTYAQERQNFANWYSYYRKRWYVALNAIGKAMPYLKNKFVGYRSINSDKSHPKLVQPVIQCDDSTNTQSMLDDLYSYAMDLDYANTPLRSGLYMVGKYYEFDSSLSKPGDLEPELVTSPLDGDPYASCKQCYAIVVTDGAWNGGAPGVGNEDKYAGPPFNDNESGMLADVAYAFYDGDLAPTVENAVPTNFVDNNEAQHMTTYGVTFGTVGHLNPDDYSEVDLYNVNIDQRVTPDWPKPSLDYRDKIDDLYHATVNGRGKYYSSSDPKELENILQEIAQTIGAEVGSGASVSINGEEVKPESGGKPHIYQAGYVSDGWSGDVMCFEILETGQVNNTSGNEIWFASRVMDAAQVTNSSYWDNGRVIATFDGTDGVSFRYDSLSATQLAALGADEATQKEIINYIRGDHSKEQRETDGKYRNRVKKGWNATEQTMEVIREPTILGDIIHSAPHFVDYGTTLDSTDGGILFAGGNDGMLHAFWAKDGKELFGYIPNQVFENLSLLADPVYDNAHRYYVDMTPYTAEVNSHLMLVGALGKGGRGFYCLDVTDLTDIRDAANVTDAETALAAKVKWEYPATPNSDDDLGYTFARAFLVRTNVKNPDKSNKWVVIAGNGYNSPNGEAILYILDVDSGSVLKKIKTGSTGCNGLSTPLLVDVDNTGTVDYVYAGDMNGNLWKFDLTADNMNLWAIAFNDGGSPASPMPLFQALDASGKVQPITSKPDAMYHCDLHGYMVVFGTGRYLAEADFTDTSPQTIYGIWDFGDDSDDSEYLGSFTRSGASKLSNFAETDYVTLLQQTTITPYNPADADLRILTNNPTNYATADDTDIGENPNPRGTVTVPAHAGWYFDLPVQKERVVQRAIIRNNTAVMISYLLEATSTDECKPERSGTSMIHEMDACSGGRSDVPMFDVNGDGKIDADDMVEIIDPTDPTKTIKVPPTGKKKQGLIYPPKILINSPNGVPQDEIKYFSSSSMQIETLREVTERTGMHYWREK